MKQLRDEREKLTAMAKAYPLADIAEKLGFVPRENGGTSIKWVCNDGQSVWIGTGANEQKFNSFTNEKLHGSNPINFVMALDQCGFVEARNKVIELIGRDDLLRDEEYQKQQIIAAARRIEAAKKEPKPFTPPEKSDIATVAIHNYLIHKRKIDPGVVEEAIADGKIYGTHAGAYSNMVSVGVDQIIEVKGIEEGKRFNKIISGSSREEQGFSIGAEGGDVKKIYLCESSIEAMSLYDLQGQHGDMYTSTSGARPTPPRWLEKFPKAAIVIAFNNDAPDPKTGKQAGQEAAAKLRESLKKADPDRPVSITAPKGKTKDWNDFLKIIKAEYGEEFYNNDNAIDAIARRHLPLEPTPVQTVHNPNDIER